MIAWHGLQSSMAILSLRVSIVINIGHVEKRDYAFFFSMIYHKWYQSHVSKLHRKKETFPDSIFSVSFVRQLLNKFIPSMLNIALHELMEYFQMKNYWYWSRVGDLSCCLYHHVVIFSIIYSFIKFFFFVFHSINVCVKNFCIYIIDLTSLLGVSHWLEIIVHYGLELLLLAASAKLASLCCLRDGLRSLSWVGAGAEGGLAPDDAESGLEDEAEVGLEDDEDADGGLFTGADDCDDAEDRWADDTRGGNLSEAGGLGLGVARVSTSEAVLCTTNAVAPTEVTGSSDGSGASIVSTTKCWAIWTA